MLPSICDERKGVGTSDGAGPKSEGEGQEMAFAISVQCVPGREAAEYWMEDMMRWGAAGLRTDPRFREAPVIGITSSAYSIIARRAL